MTSSTFSPKTERDALVVLNAVSGVGNRRALQLIEHFGSAQKIFEIPAEDLIRDTGLSEQVILSLLYFPADEFFRKEQDQMAACGARLLTFADADYPASLKKIADAPLVLYVLGTFPERLDCAVAIVGARSATLYGIETAERLARELAELGVPIVSGLARGIDAAAHRGCIKAGGGTIAVLGCGLDVIYPPQNRDLYASIPAKGCIISEFPFGTLPLSFNFPRRNRIVSGLALGVIVVE
ncbi:MAG: DNA-protecting protein DprA, partial [Candidatus Omnitrophica bacterium]|nr:DNA-protecting protein DprA [Candidatus Omnitrophota bacterium]